MIYDKNLSTVIADKKLWLYVTSTWINVFYTVLKNKMESPLHNIENCRFLKEKAMLWMDLLSSYVGMQGINWLPGVS